MSAEQQMNLLPMPQEQLTKGIQLLKTAAVRHPHLQTFLNSLVASFRSCQPGATLVVACPAERSLSEILGEFEAGVRAFDERGHRGPSDFDMVQLHAPSCLTTYRMERELLDRYRLALHTARLHHRSGPRGEGDENDWTCNPSTEAGSVCQFLRFKQPSLVVIRDAQNLALPGAAGQDVASSWRFVSDIATQSRIPHMLCGSNTAVFEMLQNAEMTEYSVIGALRPYDLSVGSESAIFKGILSDYDAALPWEAADRFLTNVDYVNSKVWGDPDRVRRWMIRAMAKAVAHGAEQLSWKHVTDTAPCTAQATLAFNEFRAIKAYFGDLAEITPPPPVRQPNKNKPGVRNETRDAANAA